jgi:hypothetical protein
MDGVYNIANIKNFHSSFNKENIKDVKDKYAILISEFLLCTVENIIVQNEKYFMFVLQRGLETIKHCFKMIYMYTRNLDLTIYHCKKAFCYYVEFIGQIGDDNHTYLQLNSKDATLFVYKKTIFEIDNDYRKKFEMTDVDRLYMKVITNIIDIFHEIILTMISKETEFRDKKESIIHFCIKRSTKIIDKIYNKNKSRKDNLENTVLVLYFIYAIKDPQIENIKYCSICESFVKKLKKKVITIDILQEKLYRSECSNYIKNFTSLRFINWIFS